MSIITTFEGLALIVTSCLIALFGYWMGRLERKPSKLFVVENKRHVEGYYRSKKTAERIAFEINLFVAGSKSVKYMDKSLYTVNELEATD